MPTPSDVRFFRTPATFGGWLAANHAKRDEVWVGFHRKATGRPVPSWAELVDEALCWGWIDGIRKRLDDERYTNRFTPRRKGSIWSAVNIARAQALIAEGRMRSPGLAAFEVRRENRSGVYSYEQRSAELPAPYAETLRRNRAACIYFESQPPSYRKAAIWWIVSAKREETRLRRLGTLVADSAAGRRIAQFRPDPPAGKGRRPAAS